MKYLILDFNGTVLDDVNVCLKAENETILKYKVDRLPLTLDDYLHVFTFPVKKYYEDVGFDFNKYTYEEVGDYWFSLYRKYRNEYKVFDGVVELLNKAHEQGYKNILLSASSEVELKKQLVELNIDQYFDEVLGIGNIYAGSKMDIAKKWVEDKDPSQCLMVGDSLHDLDCAKAMDVKCILVARGHQAKEILVKNHDIVLDDIKEVKLCA